MNDIQSIEKRASELFLKLPPTQELTKEAFILPMAIALGLGGLGAAALGRKSIGQWWNSRGLMKPINARTGNVLGVMGPEKLKAMSHGELMGLPMQGSIRRLLKTNPDLGGAHIQRMAEGISSKGKLMKSPASGMFKSPAGAMMAGVVAAMALPQILGMLRGPQQRQSPPWMGMSPGGY